MYYSSVKPCCCRFLALTKSCHAWRSMIISLSPADTLWMESSEMNPMILDWYDDIKKIFIKFHFLNSTIFQGEYMTIHITPEPEYSYVSFESNIPLSSYLGVIQRVLETFMPGKFILTIFANRVIQQLIHYLAYVLIDISPINAMEGCVNFCQIVAVLSFHYFQTSTAAESHKELRTCNRFGDWLRKDAQYSQFQNYELTYAHFVRFPSWEKWPPGSSPGRNFGEETHFLIPNFSLIFSLIILIQICPIIFVTKFLNYKSLQLTEQNSLKHYIENRLLCTQWRTKISWWYSSIIYALLLSAVFFEFIAFLQLAWEIPVIDIALKITHHQHPCNHLLNILMLSENCAIKILFMEHDHDQFCDFILF